MNSDQIELDREKYNDALAEARRLVDSHPASALKQAQALIRSAPDPRALRLAAAAHRRLGQSVEAELAELAGIKVSFESPILQQATQALREGRRPDAKAIADAVLHEEPDDLVALTISAEGSLGQRLYDEADRKLALVLQRAPGFLQASLLQANSLKSRARVREAIALLENILKRDQRNGAALNALAECYAEINDNEEALDAYRRVASIDPSQPTPWINCGQYLRVLGRSDESQEAFRKALALDAAQGTAWWALAHYFPDNVTDADVEAMERVLVDRPGTPNEEGITRIALASLADRRGDYERAFDHLSEGKRLRLQAQPYDPGKVSREVDETIRHFTDETLKSLSGSEDNSPIFVVGMPRSGSTLVERILGRHSQIEGAGELKVLPKLIDRLRYDNGRERSYVAYVASLPPEALARLGDTYVERSRDYRHTSKAKFVDKFNLNFLHAALIRRMLPNAKILDVRRDALDCCWSNFKMLFGDSHANDLRHIGHLYRDYVRLTEHMAAVDPGSILRVDYEKLVSDPEGQIRRMLDFIGVPFEAECVDFHLSDAPVATPSSEQVRRPINTRAIGSAEPYRPWLGPLIEELGDLAN